MQYSSNPTIFKPIRVRRQFNPIVCYLSTFLAMIVMAGCSSTLTSKETAREIGRRSYETQQPIPIKTSESDQRPAWTKQSSYEKDGYIYFTGGFLYGSDYALSVRCAHAEAMKVAIQSISQFVRAEFSEYAQGTNNDPESTDRYLSDGIATLSKNLHIQGVRQKKIYYEELFLPTTNRVAYHVFVILEMSESDHLRATMDAVRNIGNNLAKAGQFEAKQKAEELLDKLRKEAGQGV